MAGLSKICSLHHCKELPEGLADEPAGIAQKIGYPGRTKMLKSFAKGSVLNCKLAFGSSDTTWRCLSSMWRLVALCFFFIPGLFAVEKSSEPKEVKGKS